MTYTRSMFPRVDQTRRHLLTIEPMTRDDELGIAWWNSLTEQERARWSAIADALVRLIYAQEVYARAEDASAKWEAEHPAPKSRKGQRRWLKRLNAYRETFIPAVRQALMKAETDFADAHEALAAVPIAGMEDLKIMIAAAELYDGIELCRINRSPISRVVVAYVAEMARGGQS
jgi:hypothetical protein